MERTFLRDLEELAKSSNNIVLANAVLDMYWKCGDTHNAMACWNEMKLKGMLNRVSWNTMMKGSVESERYQTLCICLMKCGRVDVNGMKSLCWWGKRLCQSESIRERERSA